MASPSDGRKQPVWKQSKAGRWQHVKRKQIRGDEADEGIELQELMAGVVQLQDTKGLTFNLDLLEQRWKLAQRCWLAEVSLQEAGMLR
eukprot:4927330-Pleurochrysis_carterae.AAC.1